MAYDRDGNVHGGMGLDWGDLGNDGKFDLFVTTFQNESKSLYHNESTVFSDVSYPSGIGAASYPNVAFGCKFLDYDNDGWLDIAIANGHVQDNIEDIDSSTTYRQIPQLFHSNGRAADSRVSFTETTKQAGPDLGRRPRGAGPAGGRSGNEGPPAPPIGRLQGRPA